MRRILPKYEIDQIVTTIHGGTSIVVSSKRCNNHGAFGRCRDCGGFVYNTPDLDNHIICETSLSEHLMDKPIQHVSYMLAPVPEKISITYEFV